MRLECKSARPGMHCGDGLSTDHVESERKKPRRLNQRSGLQSPVASVSGPGTDEGSFDPAVFTHNCDRSCFRWRQRRSCSWRSTICRGPKAGPVIRHSTALTARSIEAAAAPVPKGFAAQRWHRDGAKAAWPKTTTWQSDDRLPRGCIGVTATHQSTADPDGVLRRRANGFQASKLCSGTQVSDGSLHGIEIVDALGANAARGRPEASSVTRTSTCAPGTWAARVAGSRAVRCHRSSYLRPGTGAAAARRTAQGRGPDDHPHRPGLGPEPGAAPQAGRAPGERAVLPVCGFVPMTGGALR